MARRTKVRSVMVELHRFGGTSSIIEQGRPYIRTTGFDQPACQIALDLDHRGFMKNMSRLRYRSRASEEEVREAMAALAAEAAKMVPDVEVPDDATIQIDLVAGAAELWAFPFEACLNDGVPLLANENRRVVLTRRIRDKFVDQKFVWPTRPRLLFAHAAVSGDLDEAFIELHVQALKEALLPWTGRRAPDERLLTVKEVSSLSDLIDARRAADFTHIHLLAHGKTIVIDSDIGEAEWGLRLGPSGSDAVRPEEIASALTPRDGLPVVITLASCDSANQADSAMPKYSLAQELHRCGVPVVVGSQFPLTKRGSVLLAKHFYAPLFKGDDVRNALHDVHVALYAGRTGHDWLSLVSYVRLPEGYADRLVETGIATELEMLKAAQREADAVLENPGGDGDQFDAAERFLRDRIDSLHDRLKELSPDAIALRQECEGLLASAHKRIAELYFRGAAHAGDRMQEKRELARAELEAALTHYRTAFRSNIHNHWLGVQQLALEAVLYGRFSEAANWSTVLLGAQIDKDRNYWAYGTIAETEFLRELAQQPADADAVQNALSLLREIAGDKFAIESTRRQFARYVDWWTTENGFFPGSLDLRRQAEAVVRLLEDDPVVRRQD